jgi:hypothetical protein
MSKSDQDKIRCLEERVTNLLKTVEDYANGVIEKNWDSWSKPVLNEEGEIKGYEKREIGSHAMVALRADREIQEKYKK